MANRLQLGLLKSFLKVFDYRIQILEIFFSITELLLTLELTV